MVNTFPFILAGALLVREAIAEGLYSKSSPVLQLSSSTYDNLIARSNYTSIVEFYAPWCGHCQSLKPAFEKAAKSLSGLAKVAAINCDEESNKPFCGSMGVKGFPTLKIVKPGKKSGKPIVEDYQGQRTAKAIVDAVIEKIPNHVKRLKDDDYQPWLNDGDRAKAILFSDKGTTSALLKAIAIDFLSSIDVAQIRDKEKGAVENFSVSKFPTFVLIPGQGKDAIKYDGEMQKEGIVAFLSQAAAPNPDPAPKKSKSSSSSKTDKKQASKDSSTFSKASESQASAQAKTDKASQTIETLEEQSQPTESPDPNVIMDDAEKPIVLPEADSIPAMGDMESLQLMCLNSKAGTCILALLPEDDATNPRAQQAVASLSAIQRKHETAKRNLFPFFQVPTSNSHSEVLRKQLSLDSSVELVATNGKRSWYRHYTKTSFGQAEVEDWIDSIRMGEGAKEKIPEGLIVDAADLPTEEVKADKKAPEDLKEALKDQMPEGMDFEFEEINDDDYERILAEAKEGAKAQDSATKGHVADEL